MIDIKTKKDVLAVPSIGSGEEIPLLTDLWLCSAPKKRNEKFRCFIIVGGNRGTGFQKKLTDWSDALEAAGAGNYGFRIEIMKSGLFHIWPGHSSAIRVDLDCSDFVFRCVPTQEIKKRAII